MYKLGDLVSKRNRAVGFVNSSIYTGEFYVKLFKTETSVAFSDKTALDSWLFDNGLRVR